MRFILAGLLVASCEKAGGIETTGGSSAHDESGPTGVRSKVIATLPNDAGIVIADAAVAVVVDAKVAQPKDVVVDKSEDDAMAFANKLTWDDPKYDTASGDMSRRQPGADLQRQLDATRGGGGRTVAIGGGGAGRGVRGDVGTAGTARAGTNDAGGDATKQSGPSGRISISSKQAFEDTTLTTDVALSKIQVVYMSGLKRCYRNYLQKDSSARGKVLLSLSVNETGQAVSPKASGFAREVDDCIARMMSGWRFPVPKDKDGEATTATFQFGLQMVPD